MLRISDALSMPVVRNDPVALCMRSLPYDINECLRHEERMYYSFRLRAVNAPLFSLMVEGKSVATQSNVHILSDSALLRDLNSPP